MASIIQKGGGIRRANTTISDDGNMVRVTLYRTVIFTLDRTAGVVRLDTGGRDTPTTHRRMNECLHYYSIIPGSIPHRVGKSDFATSNTLEIRV
jgi:hypothetical protein